MYPSVMIVDDEPSILQSLSGILSDEGFEIFTASNGYEALKRIEQESPDLVLLDIWMPDTDGVTLLKEWVEQDLLTMPVVMMSGHGTIETAVEATRIGAVDFLEKPIALQKLLSTIAKALKDDEPKSRQTEMQSQEIDLNKDEQDEEGKLLQIYLPLDLPLREAREHFDSVYFDYHLRKEAGNVSRVADKVGLERTHLYRKLKQLGIKFAKKNGTHESQ